MGNVSTNLTEEVKHTSQKVLLTATKDQYFGYNDNEIYQCIGQLAMGFTKEKIECLFVLSRPVPSIFGTCEHWSIKLITTSYYLGIDYHIGEDGLSVVAVRPKLKSCSETTNFFSYMDNKKGKRVQYKVVASITPKLLEEGKRFFKQTLKKPYNKRFLSSHFKCLGLKEGVHYERIQFNKKISDLVPMIKKFKNKDPKGYHFLKNNCQTFVDFLVHQLCFITEDNYKKKKYFYYTEVLQKLKWSEESRISSHRKMTIVQTGNEPVLGRKTTNESDNNDNTNGKFSDKKIE